MEKWKIPVYKERALILARFIFTPFSKKRYYTSDQNWIEFKKNGSDDDLYFMYLPDWFGEEHCIAVNNKLMDKWNTWKTPNWREILRGEE